MRITTLISLAAAAASVSAGYTGECKGKRCKQGDICSGPPSHFSGCAFYFCQNGQLQEYISCASSGNQGCGFRDGVPACVPN